MGGRPATREAPPARDRLAARLDAARRRAFVGRRAQVAAFDAALRGDGPQVLFVHGDGGIGKSTLLRELARRARGAGRMVVELDGRTVDATPSGIDRELAPAREPDGGGGVVLLVDGYELLGHLDGWMRADLLPRLPGDAVAVLAGREPPSREWVADPGWRELACVVRLGPLDPRESAELLTRAGAPEATRTHLAELGCGHPLTLTLLADVAQGGAVPDGQADAPDLVAALQPIFVREVPDTACARGLLASAHAWLTTEGLLRRVVGPDDAPRVWAWLASLGIVVRTAGGLHPHDLARDVLDAEHAVRDPEQYLQLHRAIRGYVIQRLRAAEGPDRHRHMQQLFHLHRTGVLVQVATDLRRAGGVARPGADGDHAAVLDMIRRTRGDAEAALAERWLAAQPDGLVVTEAPDRLLGFAIAVTIDPAAPEAGVPGDPLVAALVPRLEALGATRPGELIHLGRFIGDTDGHEQAAGAVVAGSTASTIGWLTLPVSWAAGRTPR